MRCRKPGLGQPFSCEMLCKKALSYSKIQIGKLIYIIWQYRNEIGVIAKLLLESLVPKGFLISKFNFTRGKIEIYILDKFLNLWNFNFLSFLIALYKT